MRELIIKIIKKLGMYDTAFKMYKKHIIKKRLTKRYKFENRMKNKEKLCIILAGYKDFSYDIVFGRIKEFIPKDVEVCVLSSGKYSKELSEIAKNNDWSYLSTKRNCVSLIQNVAINLFTKAKYIYKLDEDIFVTKGFFETLYKTMKDCEKNGDYKVGFVAPMIPINGFSNMLVLKRFNQIERYTKMFEKPLYCAGRDRKIESDPNAALFMWGKDGYIPNIDEMAKIVSKDEFKYTACPIRFSIGAILFKRDFFYEMGLFHVGHGPCMGVDEEQICNYAMSNSRAIIVSLNTIVGHLSFGTQNATMKNYFIENKDVFKIHK